MVSGGVMDLGVDPEIVAGLDLVADVDLGRGIVAHQHDRESGRTARSRASAATRGFSSLLISSRTRFPSRIRGILLNHNLRRLPDRAV